jgi:succinate dehydrogenase / fumarate reductase cytochrome b subunit
LTGLGLYFGVSFLIFWFIALILGPESYQKFNVILSMQIVQIIFFVVTWAFFHHLFGGIRHFIWDLGLGFSLKSVDFLSYMTLVLSLLFTILIFLLT